MPAGRLSHSARARVRPWPRQNEFLINALQCRQDRVAGGVGNGRGNSGAAGGLRIPIDFFFFWFSDKCIDLCSRAATAAAVNVRCKFVLCGFEYFQPFSLPPPTVTSFINGATGQLGVSG